MSDYSRSEIEAHFAEDEPMINNEMVAEAFNVGDEVVGHRVVSCRPSPIRDGPAR